MGIIESLSFFFASIFCMSACFSLNRKYYEQEAAIYRLENQTPPMYQEDPAPPYQETNESTPILPPPADQLPN